MFRRLGSCLLLLVAVGATYPPQSQNQPPAPVQPPVVPAPPPPPPAPVPYAPPVSVPVINIYEQQPAQPQVPVQQYPPKQTRPSPPAQSYQLQQTQPAQSYPQQQTQPAQSYPQQQIQPAPNSRYPPPPPAPAQRYAQRQPQAQSPPQQQIDPKLREILYILPIIKKVEKLTDGISYGSSSNNGGSNGGNQAMSHGGQQQSGYGGQAQPQTQPQPYPQQQPQPPQTYGPGSPSGGQNIHMMMSQSNRYPAPPIPGMMLPVGYAHIAAGPGVPMMPHGPSYGMMPPNNQNSGYGSGSSQGYGTPAEPPSPPMYGPAPAPQPSTGYGHVQPSPLQPPQNPGYGTPPAPPPSRSYATYVNNNNNIATVTSHGQSTGSDYGHSGGQIGSGGNSAQTQNKGSSFGYVQSSPAGNSQVSSSSQKGVSLKPVLAQKGQYPSISYTSQNSQQNGGSTFSGFSSGRPSSSNIYQESNQQFQGGYGSGNSQGYGDGMDGGYGQPSIFNVCEDGFNLMGFCDGKFAGLYSHPNPQCFIQCDQFESHSTSLCAPGTAWMNSGYEPSSVNQCMHSSNFLTGLH